jgi:serine/threonine protein phosphatase PrpC
LSKEEATKTLEHERFRCDQAFEEGRIVSLPNPATERVTSVLLRSIGGAVLSQGTRETMEDYPLFYSGSVCDRPARVAAVFDGHGGGEVAKMASRAFLPSVERLYKKLLPLMDEQLAFINALKITGPVLHKAFKKEGALFRGTTVSMLILFEQRAYGVSIGDGVILAIRNRKPIPLSRPARVGSSDLERSALKRGGTLDLRRKLLCKSGTFLEPLRTIGDAMPGVNPRAKIVAFEPKKGDRFLVSSDGLFDLISPAQAAASAHLPDLVARAVAYGLATPELGAVDNITALEMRV